MHEKIEPVFKNDQFFFFLMVGNIPQILQQMGIKRAIGKHKLLVAYFSVLTPLVVVGSIKDALNVQGQSSVVCCWGILPSEVQTTATAAVGACSTYVSTAASGSQLPDRGLPPCWSNRKSPRIPFLNHIDANVVSDKANTDGHLFFYLCLDC